MDKMACTYYDKTGNEILVEKNTGIIVQANQRILLYHH